MLKGKMISHHYPQNSEGASGMILSSYSPPTDSMSISHNRQSSRHLISIDGQLVVKFHRVSNVSSIVNNDENVGDENQNLNYYYSSNNP